MLKAFQIIMIVVLVVSFVGTIADEKRKNQILITFGTSGVMFLMSVLIEGIISKM